MHSKANIKTDVAALESHTFSKSRTAAAKVGVSTRTLFRWADRGLISKYKVGARTVLFDNREVARLVESGRIVWAGEKGAQ